MLKLCDLVRRGWKAQVEIMGWFYKDKLSSDVSIRTLLTAPALVSEVKVEGVRLDPDGPAIWSEG